MAIIKLIVNGHLHTQPATMATLYNPINVHNQLIINRYLYTQPVPTATLYNPSKQVANTFKNGKRL
jgi:hypothetical protein